MQPQVKRSLYHSLKAHRIPGRELKRAEKTGMIGMYLFVRGSIYPENASSKGIVFPLPTLLHRHPRYGSQEHDKHPCPLVVTDYCTHIQPTL